MRIRTPLFFALGVLASVPSIAQPAASDLGSPREAATVYSSDYRALVAGALPKVGADALGRRLAAVRAEAAVSRGLAVRDAASWTALFGLDAKVRAGDRPGELVELEAGAFLADPEAGRFLVSLAHPDAEPVPRGELDRQLPEIRRAHEALAERIGVPKGEIFHTDFREILAQSTPAPGLAGARESEIESFGATTTLLRASGGLLVDGSYASLTSLDARRLDRVEVRWPAIRLLPEVDGGKPLAPSDLTDLLTRRIESAAHGREINVLMAVVLRPVEAGPRTYFVPSLRVGLAPKAVKERDGYRTEAGEEFYVDLVAGLEDLPERDDRELVPESLER
jgi:hypothetical protein